MDKNFFKTALTIFIVVYLATSFIIADINFMNWAEAERAFMIIIFLVFTYLVELNKALSE